MHRCCSLVSRQCNCIGAVIIIIIIKLSSSSSSCIVAAASNQDRQDAQVQVSGGGGGSGAEKLWKRRRRKSSPIKLVPEPINLQLLLLALLLYIHCCCLASTLTDYDGATFYKATLGSRVRIACNGSHWDERQDQVALVLWFKGTVERHSVPIYTVDARQRPLSSGGARHFVDDQYKGRARFVANSTPPYLDLAPLEADDQSEYRCRIDYRARPRENFLIILFVLVPPKSVHIMDSNGRSLEQIYGPLSEQSNLTLLCLSRGGRPAPSLTWRRQKSSSSSSSGAKNRRAGRTSSVKLIDDSYLTLTDFLALRQSAQLLSFSNEANDDDDDDVAVDDNNQQRKEQQRNEQQQQQRRNSINADPSFAQLTSLWRKWTRWPEYNFFAKQLHLNNNNNSNSFGAAGSGLLSSDVVAQKEQQLLTMNVHESITTSVNYLQVDNLVHLIEELAQSEAGDEEAEQSEQQPTRPLLTCQASNAHYDLRTLIRLFAPPSLTASAAILPETSATATATTTTPQLRATLKNTSHLSKPLGQLVEASERALLASLRTADEQPQSQQQQQQQPLDELAEQQQQSQIRIDAAQVTLPNGTRGQSALNSIAAVIYQQLARPHHLLTSSSSSSSSSSQVNSHLMAPSEQQQQQQLVSQLIALDIYLRPSNVIISQPTGRVLSAGQVAEFTCQASGSQPPAKLSWFRNGQPLEQKLYKQMSSSGASESTGKGRASMGKLSESRLSLRLSPGDHRATLLCRAQNEQLAKLSNSNSSSSGNEAATLEDSITLTVQYSPKVRLELGNKMLSNVVREGADIFFVCQVDAVPAIKDITWLHNRRPLNESVVVAADQHRGSSGSSAQATTAEQQRQPLLPPTNAGLVISSNNSLVLQRVRLKQRGQYTCLASNSEGISESNPLELRVLHAPLCVPLDPKAAAASEQQVNSNEELQSATMNELLIGSKAVALRQTLTLSCKMLAEPLDESLEFSWYLNNSYNERRVLFTGPPSEQQRQVVDRNGSINSDVQSSELTLDDTTTQLLAGSRVPGSRLAAAAETTTTTEAAAYSQLSFSPIDSQLDYGRLYCLARNSVGQQKRSCVYDILQPTDVSGTKMAEASLTSKQFSCLTANLTESSVWIACKWPTRAEAKGELRSSRFALQLYNFGIAQRHLLEANDEGSLNIDTVSSIDELDAAHLEANLTAGNLRDPFFALNGLRAQTQYILRVLPLDSFSGQPLTDEPALVNFSTTLNSSPASATTTTLNDHLAPYLEPIDEPQQRHLMSLISTRSTTTQQHFGNELNPSTQSQQSGNHNRSNSYRQTYAARQQVQVSFVSRLWSTLSSLLSDTFSRTSTTPIRHSGTQTQTSRSRANQTSYLSEISNISLITVVSCVLLLLSLTFTLLLHRYSLTGCSRRQKRPKSKSKALERKQQPPTDQVASAAAAVGTGENSRRQSDSSLSTAQLRKSSKGSIATGKEVSSDYFQQQSGKQSATCSLPASTLLLPDYSTITRQQPAAAMSKSRSSVCFDSDLIHQQQRLMQFNASEFNDTSMSLQPIVDGTCWPSSYTTAAQANCNLFEEQYAHNRHLLASADDHELTQLNPNEQQQPRLVCELTNDPTNTWRPASRSNFLNQACHLIHQDHHLNLQESYTTTRRHSSSLDNPIAETTCLLAAAGVTNNHQNHQDFASLSRQTNQQQQQLVGLSTKNMLAYPKQAERNQRMKLQFRTAGVSSSLNRCQVKQVRSKQQQQQQQQPHVLAPSSSLIISDESGAESYCHWIQSASGDTNTCSPASNDHYNNNSNNDSFVAHGNQLQMIELIPSLPQTTAADFSDNQTTTTNTTTNESNTTTCSRSCMSRKTIAYAARQQQPNCNHQHQHLAVASPSDAGSLDQADPSPSSLTTTTTNNTLSQAESLLLHQCCDAGGGGVKHDPQYVIPPPLDYHQVVTPTAIECSVGEGASGGAIGKGKLTNPSILKGSNTSRKAAQY